MAERRDHVMDELRQIRRQISKELLEAEHRDGSFLPTLRRMERQAVQRARKALNGNGSRGSPLDGARGSDPA